MHSRKRFANISNSFSRFSTGIIEMIRIACVLAFNFAVPEIFDIILGRGMDEFLPSFFCAQHNNIRRSRSAFD